MPSQPKAGKSRKQTKAVQTRIAFAPAASSPAPKDSPSPARVVYESPRRSSAMATSSRSTSSRAGSTPHTSQARLSFAKASHTQGDSDSDDDGIPEGKKFAVVIRPSSSKVSAPAKSTGSATSNSARKATSFMPAASKPKSKSRLQTIVNIDSSEDEPAEDENDAYEKPLKRTPKPAARAKPVESEDDEPVQKTPRLAGRRVPSYLADSDEEPLTKPPKAIVRDGRVVIPGEATPSPSPDPEEMLPKKAVNSRSFIAGGQLGSVRHKEDYQPLVVGRKAASPEKRKKEKSKSKAKDTIVLLSDDNNSDSDVDKAPASSRKTPKQHKHKEADEDSYDSEPAGYMLEHQAVKAGRKDKVFGTRITKDEHPTGTPHINAEDDEHNVMIVQSPFKKQQKSVKQGKKAHAPAGSDSEPEVPIMPTPKRRRLSPPPITDDEDDMPVVPTPAKRPSKRARSSSSEADLPVVPTPGNKRRKPSAPTSDNDVEMIDLDDDIDNDSLFAASPKQKKTAPVAPMRAQAIERARVDKKAKDKERPKKPTERETVAQRVRAKHTKRHRTQKEKAMELMRRKRNGEKITQLTDSESSEEEHKPKMGMYDTDSDVEVLDHFDDEEEDDHEGEVRKSLLPQNRNKNRDDNDDDDFVVEDDDVPLGVPGGLHEIPIEFTNQAHKKLSEHFKDAVEWMVQRRINPGFQKDDPVYVTAFRKLEDDPTGLVNSKLVSTVWNAKFVRALKARPDYQEMEVGSSVGEGKKCAACNRGKHPVSFVVTLKGKPYNKKTLEEIDQSDDDSDNSDGEESSSGKSISSNRSRDEQGVVLPSAKKEWYLGSTCKANASAAHGLIHWKHFLDEWVLDALQLEGHLEAEKLAERLMWKQKRLTQLSQDIVDEWTEAKRMKTLYNEFKQRIEMARTLTHDRFGR